MTGVELEHVCIPSSSSTLSDWILEGVSFRAPVASITAVVGPTGAGKTTLLRTIAGLVWPVYGSVLVEGQDVATLGTGARRRLRRQTVAYLSDRCPLILELPVLENICLPLLMNKRPFADAMALARGAAARLDIRDCLALRPDQLSLGQRRLTGVARVLTTDSPVLVLDEPTSGLDSRHREEVLCALGDEKTTHKRTILFSTHHIPDVLCADKVLVLWGKRIAEELHVGEKSDSDEVLARITRCFR